MIRIDFVVPVCPDQQQVPDIPTDQQIFQQIQCRRVQPLQIVEKQSQRMLRLREYADESTENQLKTALRILGRNFGDGWLFPNNEPQFRNQIHDQLAVRIQCFAQGIAPFAQLCLALAQKRTHKALKCLRQSGIRDVAFELIEFA